MTHSIRGIYSLLGYSPVRPQDVCIIDPNEAVSQENDAIFKSVW